MRKLCVFVFLVVTLQYCISCQKQLNFDSPQDLPGDSLVLVKTLRGIEFDSNDGFLSQEWQTFTYDSILNRTVVEIADSDKYSPGKVVKYNTIFQYDAAKRLSSFSTSGGYEPIAQMDMTYGSNGDLTKLTMNNNWVGKTFDIQFKTTLQNGQKVITVYDTSGNSGASGGDTRPEISNYTFDSNDRLINETIYYTYYFYPQFKYRDTFELRNYYNNNNSISKVIRLDTYLADPANNFIAYSRDSTLYSSGGNAAELRNSFLYVYRNMYWLNVSEFSTGFTNAINKGEMLPYTGSAIKTGEQWSFLPPDPTLQDHFQGIYQNTFDANGLLSATVYPKKFGNKYGGRTEVYYTYTKAKKY